MNDAVRDLLEIIPRLVVRHLRQRSSIGRQNDVTDAQVLSS